MNIYLQCITFEQNQKMLDIFRLPQQLLAGFEIKEQFMWIGLNGEKSGVDSLESLFGKAVDLKFKQIGYETKFKPVKICPNVILKKAVGVLVLPPTSPLWADEEYWQKGTFHFAYRHARDAKLVRDEAERAEIEKFPAILELTLKLSTRLKQDQVARLVAGWLGKTLKPESFKCVTCIVGDIDDDMLESGLDYFGLKYHLYSLYFFLNRYILGVHLLRDHIDRLHSILIHNENIMAKIAGRLDLHKPINLGEGYSVITIPREKLANPENLKLVTKYVIPQDDSTSWAGFVKRESNK